MSKIKKKVSQPSAKLNPTKLLTEAVKSEENQNQALHPRQNQGENKINKSKLVSWFN